MQLGGHGVEEDRGPGGQVFVRGVEDGRGGLLCAGWSRERKQ